MPCTSKHIALARDESLQIRHLVCHVGRQFSSMMAGCWPKLIFLVRIRTLQGEQSLRSIRTNRAVHCDTKSQEPEASEQVKAMSTGSLHINRAHLVNIQILFCMQASSHNLSRVTKAALQILGHRQGERLTCASRSPMRKPKNEVALFTRMGCSSRALM